MFIKNLKRIIAIPLCAGMLCLSFLYGYADSKDILTNIDNNVNSKSIVTFIIDAGHGGMDGGASGLNGSCEKDLNLKIATLVYSILTVSGNNCVMTRSDDSMLGDGAKGSAKMADLKYRLELAEKYKDGIFLSIHMNKFPKENCKGMTLYYSVNNEKSEFIASIIRDNNIKYLQSWNTREMKKADSAIYILNRITIPAVLVECGFLSNEEESALLMNQGYQKKLAMVIACSLLSSCQ